MIKSVRDAEAETVFSRRFCRRLPRDVQAVALRKLRMLAKAHDVLDVRSPPGDRLERLAGDRAGQYSVRIDDQWRICVVWNGGDAYDVEICDRRPRANQCAECRRRIAHCHCTYR